MIIFKTLRWKNFLSTGNNWTKIDLEKHRSTLVVGHNGSGKSTILDALSFALFGRGHRNISKTQLVNSINGKNSLVEVEFSIGRSRFKIIRGIKPNVFEIWQDGTMMNQSSHAKEYQKVLEQNIIKLNHKSFHQIVVLGSSSFIPFMQLQASHRRGVIEDLLDINIFSQMNGIIKEKNSGLKERLRDTEYSLDLLKNKIESQKKYIRDITQINDDEVKVKRDQIDECNTEISELTAKTEKATTHITEHKENVEKLYGELHNKRDKLGQYKHEFGTQIKRVVKDAKFYEDNTHCPTCDQDILEETRTTKLTESKDKAKELQDAISKVEEEATANTNQLDSIEKDLEEVRAYETCVISHANTIKRLHKQIDGINKDIERLSAREGDLGQANTDLNTMRDNTEVIVDERTVINEEYAYNNVMAEMLKDTGIKTKVIKQYLPVINKLVNQYLQTLDFFVHFNLDENFAETIRSRHRDAFSYDSFSEGEKQRIDLALLFAWRMIAKMKNSVATNLLVLDETFDSSLDHDGVENLMKILNTLDGDTNVFVISHKGEILEGRFENRLEFKKPKNFSEISEMGLQSE